MMLVSVAVTATDTHQAIEAVFRIEQARLIAGLARMVRDVGVAEELAQDALVAALEQWPKSGIPEKPGAWLMTAAKHRAIDRIRRAKLIERKHEELGHELAVDGEAAMPDLDAALDDDIGDDLLRLMFTACHPVLATEARVALTLRLIAGLTTGEIARAFLAPEPTIAQRIVRAKRTLAEKRVPFEVPRGPELAERLASVLSVIYLIFNEGYAATGGSDWIRPQLCEEALRLGRILAELAPGEPEVHGLVALMEIQASRFAARTTPTGEPILLLDQNRARWDQLLIRRGLAALERAAALGSTRGPYALQAGIAACHARARTGEETDWARIVGLYGELSRIVPSPVVELNRAVALSMLLGPAAGLEIVDALNAEPALKSYHLLPSVRGDLLLKLGRSAEARLEFERAADMTRNARERDLLLARAEACAAGPSPAGTP
jgi:RNA polymerase sigma factor (sigma-70 family)